MWTGMSLLMIGIRLIIAFLSAELLILESAIFCSGMQIFYYYYYM